MINLMRKNQRWLMIFISVIVIIAFVFLYNQTDLDKLGQDSVGTIYGEKVKLTDFARSEKQFEVARGLGMYDLLQVLASGDSREQVEDYVWNSFVLRAKAKALQIEPTEKAIARKIQQLPPFQTDGQFDFEKYQGFVSNALIPRGFSEEQLNDLIRDDLRLAKLRELIGSSVVTSEDDVREAYGSAFRKRHLQVVKFSRTAFASPVTAEEIKTYFEKNKETFQTEEKRSVKYLAFELAEDQKKLTGKERVAVLQPISEQADAFSQKLLKAGASFDAIAQETKLAIKETAPFSADAPPPEIARVSQGAATIFSLTPELPDSDVLQTDDGFYLFHLAKIEPALPQTLEEATPKITRLLTDEKVAAGLAKKAAEVQTGLRAALKNGQTFTQAAEAAGLKAEIIPPYVPAELQQSQEVNPDRLIQFRAASLSEGAISELLPTEEGGAIAFLEKLEPLDEAKWKGDREVILDRYFTSRVEMSFNEWFRAQRAAANVKSGQATAG